MDKYRSMPRHYYLHMYVCVSLSLLVSNSTSKLCRAPRKATTNNGTGSCIREMWNLSAQPVSLCQTCVGVMKCGTDACSAITATSATRAKHTHPPHSYPPPTTLLARTHTHIYPIWSTPLWDLITARVVSPLLSAQLFLQ